MRFQLHIDLTEKDYLAFNQFHSLQSPVGKKMVQKSRIFFVCAMVFMAALIFLIYGRTTFAAVYAAVLGVFTVVYLLLFKQLIKRNVKTQIKRMKSAGKLPFDPKSTLEFYEDTLVEVSAGKRTEQSYAVLERVCRLGEDYLFLYSSSVNAYILPLAQVRSQTDPEAFLAFLAGKCGSVEECAM